MVSSEELCHVMGDGNVTVVTPSGCGLKGADGEPRTKRTQARIKL